MKFDRIDAAERHLDRMHSFFARIDTKVAAVAAWLSVELAIVALNTKLADLHVSYIWIPFAAYVITTGVAAANLWKCIFPDSRGGTSSLIYFAEIAKRTEANFVRDYKAMSEVQLLDDLAGQIWRNAEIVCDKYAAVQRSVRWATFSLGFLIATLLATSILHQSLPQMPGS